MVFTQVILPRSEFSFPATFAKFAAYVSPLPHGKADRDNAKKYNLQGIDAMPMSSSLFDRVGGKATLSLVHKIFYDKVYVHPWLQQYFTDKPQEILESQQTDFMAQLFGGPKAYAGKVPKVAHQHMVITQELFELRSEILKESLTEAGVSESNIKEWLAVDATFSHALVKETESECTKSYATQPILNFHKPMLC